MLWVAFPYSTLSIYQPFLHPKNTEVRHHGRCLLFDSTFKVFSPFRISQKTLVRIVLL